MTGRPRFVDLAHGESDLDVRREQRRSFQRSVDLGARPADRRECGLGLALGEAELRQPWLWLPAETARSTVGRLRRAEIALEPEKLRLPVVGNACRRIVGFDESLPGEPRLLECVLPGALQLKNLSSVHEAAPRERNELGLLLLPVGQRLSPLRVRGRPRTRPSTPG